MFRRELAWRVWGFAALLWAGCTAGSSPVPCESVLQIELDAGPESEGSQIVIDQVAWTIRAPHMEPMTGTIETSASGATASVEVFGLPPGSYTVDLEASSAGGETTCRGSSRFEVKAGAAVETMVLLRCKGPGERGAARVNGKLNACAELTKVVVAPLQTSVGYTIETSAEARDTEGDEIEYAWTGDGGTFEEAAASATLYRCEEPGDHEITITVSDDGFEHCRCDWAVDVRCIGNGGTGGAGGAAGGGGAGAGGAGGAAGGGGSAGRGGAGGAAGTGGGGGAGAGGTGGRGASGGSAGSGGGSGGTDGDACEITISLTGSESR